MVVEPMPKLSVIVPVYNTEKYLRECIDSILAQTFTDFELILVDDGSTDGSGAICDEYAEKDPRIQVIHQENGGVTRARKAAMRIAAGSWISFIDSDDWISPDMFAAMLEKASNSKAQIVICDAVLEFSNKSQIAETLADEGFCDKATMVQQIYPTMIMSFEHRRPGMAGWLCNKIFERSLLEKVFWSVEDSFVFSEDALCCYAALLESENIYIYRKPLYHYRQHTDSAMHQYNGTKRYVNLLRSYKAHEDLLKMHGSAYLDQLQDFIAVNTITNLRNVLLYNRETPLGMRLSQAKEFVSQTVIITALHNAIKKHSDRKERLKVLLAMHKRMGLLYLLFSVKEFKLNLHR